LTRAMHEYFVGGIKTNISLFRCILTDTDFQAGNVDTGYLDRLLKTGPPHIRREDADVAAIAAGIFAVLDPASAVVGNGNSSTTANTAANGNTAASWKRAARAEALG
jgi:acetyl-CoA carboxylase, biotin carboxylase subunit